MYITCGCAPFIGYYFGLGEKVSFTETTADVFSYKEQKTTTYKLHQFIPAHMPPQSAFRPQKRLKWLLQAGYVPRIARDQITFIQTIPSIQDLLRAGDAIRKDLSRENPKDMQIEDLKKNGEIIEVLITLFDEFRLNLIEKKYDDALECLEAAHAHSKKALIVRRLLADFLFFLKRPEACDLYFELHKLNPKELDLLEKAIILDPYREIVLTKIKNGGFSQETKLSLAVAGFLASGGAVESYFVKESTGVEFDPLMLVARLQMTKDGDKKRKLLKLMSQTEEEPSPTASPTPSPRRGVPLLRAKQVMKTVARLSPLSKSTGSIVSPFKPRDERSASFVISSPQESGAQRGQREEYIIAIDSLLQAKKYDEAREKLELAIKDCQIATPFYERLITILPKCKSQFTVDDCLQKLLFDEMLSPEKVEYVASQLYSRHASYDYGRELVDRYMTTGKVQEAQKLLFSLAKASLHSPEKVKECLEKLGSLGQDPASYLTEDELKTLYLLGQLVGRSYPNLFVKREQQVHKTALHSGEGAFFCFDHPRYVACWISFDMRILFTKERAEVYFFDESRTEILPLIIPECVPDSERFFMADSLRWLLSRGYRPSTLPEGVRFEESSCIQDPSGVFAKARNKPELAEFLAYFKQQKYGLAHASLLQVNDKQASREVYAEFYAFLRRPEAVSRFRELGRSSDDALYYMQRALAAATACKARDTYSIYLQLVDLLKNSHFSDYHAGWISLHAFLYFSSRDPNRAYADAFFEKAPDPYRLLAKVSCLERPKDIVIDNSEIATRYKVCRLALVEMCRQLYVANSEEFFTTDTFSEKLNAMSFLVLEIKNISRTKVDMSELAGHLEQLGVDIAKGDFAAARKTLFAARDCFLPAETVERKNCYIELENDPDLGAYYRAKNECDDEKERPRLEQIFNALSNKRSRINLKGIFLSEEFNEQIKQIEASIRKTDLEELKANLGMMKKHMHEARYKEAEKALKEIDEMVLPPTIREKVQELYRIYLSFPAIQTIEQTLSRGLYLASHFSYDSLMQKMRVIKGAPECFKRFDTHLQERNYQKAELTLVRAKAECVNEDIRRKLHDLHAHLLIISERGDKTIEFLFEFLEEKEKLGTLSRNSTKLGGQREGYFSGLLPRMQSEMLYYLEPLLRLCIEKNHARLHEVYDKIFDALQEKNAPKKVVSLIALHALFHLIDINPHAARKAYQRITIDDPILFPFARLAILERKAKTLRQEQYFLLSRFFESQECISAYFGEEPICSLEAEVFSECLKIFQCERMYQEKKLALVFVDTLRERGFYKAAFEMIGLVSAKLNDFNIGAARYSYYLEERLQAGRFSCLKREVALSLLLGNTVQAEMSFESLIRLYEKHGKSEKAALMTKLSYAATKSQAAFRRLPKTAVLCLDNAFRSIEANLWTNVEESIEVMGSTDDLSETDTFNLQIIKMLLEKQNHESTEKKLSLLDLDS